MKKANDTVDLIGLKPEVNSFIEALESVLDRELIITSGYRSPEHPIEASKKKPGEHSEGLAVDVYCSTPYEFLQVAGEAYKLGCKRIGVSRKNGFIHLGFSKRKPKSLWTY